MYCYLFMIIICVNNRYFKKIVSAIKSVQLNSQCVNFNIYMYVYHVYFVKHTIILGALGAPGYKLTTSGNDLSWLKAIRRRQQFALPSDKVGDLGKQPPPRALQASLLLDFGEFCLQPPPRSCYSQG